MPFFIKILHAWLLQLLHTDLMLGYTVAPQGVSYLLPLGNNNVVIHLIRSKTVSFVDEQQRRGNF